MSLIFVNHSFNYDGFSWRSMLVCCHAGRWQPPPKYWQIIHL